MTPSHHGLGSVVLCTAGAHTVAVDMRHVAGTGRVGRDRDHVVDLATGLGLAADRLRAGAAPADAGRPRVARRREGVAAVRHQRAHPAQRARRRRDRRATSRRWPRSTASGTWSSTCARSPAAARTPPKRRRPREGPRSAEETPASRARTRLARRAALGHLVVFSAETSRSEAHPLAYALSAAQVVEVTFVPDIAPMPLAPAARARPLRLARPPAPRRRPAGPADDGSAAAPPTRSGSSSAAGAARATCSACSPPRTSRWCACPSPTRRPCATSRSIAAARGRSSTSARPRWSCPTSRAWPTPTAARL